MERTTKRVSNELVAFTSMDTNTIASRTAGMEDLMQVIDSVYGEDSSYCVINEIIKKLNESGRLPTEQEAKETLEGMKE